MAINYGLKCLFIALVVLQFTYFTSMVISSLHSRRDPLENFLPFVVNNKIIPPVQANMDLPIVARKVYYDNRTVGGQPRNLVCILAEVHKLVLTKKIALSCELNGYSAQQVEIIEDPIAGWIMREFKNVFSWYFAMIKCSGFPYEAITNGSFARVLYNRGGVSFASAEHPLYLSSTLKDMVTPLKGVNSVLVCTTLFGNPPCFSEWLKHQKLLGIDRVHLNVDKSFLENATLVYPFLKEALDSGFVSMEVWETNANVFYYSQSLKYQDCIMRYQGVFDIALMIDSDDFFIPLQPNEKDIHFYTKIIFKNSMLESVQIPWKRLRSEMSQNLLANLRNGGSAMAITLKSPVGERHKQNKVMVRLSAVEVVTIHSSSSLPGFISNQYVNEQLMYIAHI